MSKESVELKAAWRAAYRVYILQISPSKHPLTNRHNLFYDINYWDRRWFKKVHKSLAARGLSLRSE